MRECRERGNVGECAGMYEMNVGERGECGGMWDVQGTRRDHHGTH